MPNIRDYKAQFPAYREVPDDVLEARLIEKGYQVDPVSPELLEAEQMGTLETVGRSAWEGLKSMGAGVREAMGPGMFDMRPQPLAEQMQPDTPQLEAMRKASPLASGIGEALPSVAGGLGTGLALRGAGLGANVLRQGLTGFDIGASHPGTTAERLERGLWEGGLAATGESILGGVAKGLNRAYSPPPASARTQELADQFGVDLIRADSADLPDIARTATRTSSPIRQAREAQSEQLKEAFTAMNLGVRPGGQSLGLTPAEELQAVGRGVLERNKGRATQLFDEAQRIAGDEPNFNPANLGNLSRELLEQEQARALPDPKLVSTLEDLQEWAGTVKTFGDMRGLRSDLGSMVRDASRGEGVMVGDRATGTVKRLFGAVEKDIAEGAESIPDLAPAYKAADNYYRNAVVPFKSNQVTRNLLSKADDADRHLTTFLKGRGEQRYRDILGLMGAGAQRPMADQLLADAMAKATSAGGEFSPAKLAQAIRAQESAFHTILDPEAVQGFAELAETLGRRIGQSRTDSMTGLATIPYLSGGMSSLAGIVSGGLFGGGVGGAVGAAAGPVLTGGAVNLLARALARPQVLREVARGTRKVDEVAEMLMGTVAGGGSQALGQAGANEAMGKPMPPEQALELSADLSGKERQQVEDSAILRMLPTDEDGYVTAVPDGLPLDPITLKGLRRVLRQNVKASPEVMLSIARDVGLRGVFDSLEVTPWGGTNWNGAMDRLLDEADKRSGRL